MSEANGDILTVSLGPFSGITTTHFWNSTTNHDALRTTLYQQSGTKGGKAVPRLVVVDWCGGSTIKKQWKLNKETEEDRDPEVGADGDQEMEDAEGDPEGEEEGAKTDKDALQQDVEEVVHWWKYMVPDLHPRTVNLMPERVSRDHSNQGAFGAGQVCWNAENQMAEDTMDSIRYFLEGMDRCQGINLLVDSNSMFGGLGLQMIYSINDDHGRVPVLTHGVMAHDPDEADGFVRNPEDPTDFERMKRWEQQGLNRCLSHALLSDASAGYVPIDVSQWCSMNSRAPGWLGSGTCGISVEPQNPVDAGAVVAAALSASLHPLVGGALKLAHYCDILRPLPSMRLSTLQCSMPVHLEMGSNPVDLGNVLERMDYGKFMRLSHGWPVEGGKMLLADRRTHVVSQVFGAKGLGGLPAKGAHDDVANECWSERMRTPRTFSSLGKEALHLSQTFPVSLLPSNLNVFGWRCPDAPDTYTSPEDVPTQLPIASHVTTTCASALMLDALHTRLRKTDRKRHPEQHIEADQYNELDESMATMVDEYDQGIIDRND